MTSNRNPIATRIVLTAGLLLGTVAAHAASGYIITRDLEAKVVPGMTAADVRQALGRPERSIKYANEPGPTFIYQVVDTEEHALFDIDFDGNGKVIAVNEFMEDTPGAGGDGGE